MEQTSAGPWLVAESDGDRLRVRTSEALVARRRLTLRLFGVAGAVAGLSLLLVSPWALGLVALGLAAVAAAPLVYRQSDLLEIDMPEDRIVLRQFAVGRGRAVRASDFRAVRGAYEIYGWDPRSTIYAELDGGERVPVLVFVGTHDDLAEAACALLGRLLGVEATYTGSYGPTVECFTPASRSHEAAR